MMHRMVRFRRLAIMAVAAGLCLFVPRVRAADKTSAPEGLGTQEHESGNVDVVLQEVKRTSGDTLTVRWKYVNRSNERKQLTHERTGWLDPYRLAADAYVLDTSNKTKYMVARDDDKHPIAGRHGSQNAYITLGPKQTLATWAKFEAPPASVEKVTVSIPGAAPFEDISISK